MVPHGYAKILDYTKISPSASERFISKPSSATTACTYAPNELSYQHDISSLLKNKRSKKSSRLVGQKRSPSTRLGKVLAP